MLKQIYSAVSVWLGWLGVAAGVMSVISVLVRGLDIGLQPVLTDFVGFYRELIRPLYELIQRIPLPFTVSQEAVEWGALYVALFGLSARAEFSPVRNDLWSHRALPPFGFLYLRQPNWPARWKQVVKCAFLIPFFFMQPLLDLVPFRKRLKYLQTGDAFVYSEDGTKNETADHSKKWSANMAQSIFMFVTFPVAVVLFFVINAYGL
jgi:hypothetical protein